MQYRKIPVHEKYMRRKRNRDVCLINVVTEADLTGNYHMLKSE